MSPRFLAAAFVACIAAQAQAQHGRSPSPTPNPGKGNVAAQSGCTYRYASADDGCLGAPRGVGSTSGPLYQNTAFFTSARQSGQSYATGHPPPWNVAGVDYPVGVPGGTVLKDPASATLPAGCAYSATGTSVGGPVVRCSSGSNPTFDSFDFGLHNCVQLRIDPAVTGTLKITNSKFANGSKCSALGWGLVAALNPSSLGAVDVENSYFDFAHAGFPAPLFAGLWLNGPRLSLTLKYNALLHCPCRPVGDTASGNQLIAYNYIEGFSYSRGDAHGEVVDPEFANATVASSVYSFNTVLQGRDVLAAGTTTMFYFVSGQRAPAWKAIQVDHNLTVANRNGATPTVSASVAEIASTNTYGTCTYTSNYTDDTGAFAAFTNIGSATCSNSFSGNVNMVTGATISSYGTL